MRRQGRCSDPRPDALTVLDRLAGLRKVISEAVMEQALLDTGRDKQRACRLSHRAMLWVVLAMGLLTDLPIRSVFKHARRMRPGDETPSRSNLCEARQRLGFAPVK
jgi:Insertion element 4 transposase N-terminal